MAKLTVLIFPSFLLVLFLQELNFIRFKTSRGKNQGIFAYEDASAQTGRGALGLSLTARYKIEMPKIGPDQRFSWSINVT